MVGFRHQNGIKGNKNGMKTIFESCIYNKNKYINPSHDSCAAGTQSLQNF